jgi:hypothetical protein
MNYSDDKNIIKNYNLDAQEWNKELFENSSEFGFIKSVNLIELIELHQC